MPDTSSDPKRATTSTASSTDGSPMADAGFASLVLADIEASPSPYHCAMRAADLLLAAGYQRVDRSETLPSDPGGYFIVHGGALIAWRLTERQTRGFCVVGAHTDSPNLRLRTNADVTSAGWSQVGVETYGGLLLNSWLDRDLGLAGRVSVATNDGPVDVLVRQAKPIMRVPQLAIHLDREIRDKGLLLNPQQHLTPLWALSQRERKEEGDSKGESDGEVLAYVADLADVPPDTVLAWELMAYDTQPPSIVGRDDDLLASARIDNQLSCFAAVRALNDLDPAGLNSAEARTPVLALYDHEEIGSASSTGAAGGFLANLLERISAAAGAARVDHLERLANSIVVSADGAHATHPNYADRHEPDHHIAVNGGIVIKRNANQRYATDAESEGFMRQICADAEVPVQTYIHRNDLPCGSTIGPITAAELAVPTVDIGAPQLAMHSIREMAGVADVGFLAAALRGAWSAH